MGVGRREAIKRGTTGLAAIASTRLLGESDRPLPNILWLVSEDNNPFIGAYGDKIARTPTIDALAAKGALYRNVYSTGPVCAISRFAILTGINAQSCAPANQMRAVAHLPSYLRTYPEYLRSAGYYCTNNWKTDYNCDVSPARIWNESSAKAHWRNRPAGQRFMAVFNYMTTHESMLFHVTPGRTQPADVRVPAYLPDTPDVRNDIASYYNLMERMDGQLAERLAELEADGLADDTIVFYYSDNGGVLPWSKRYSNEAGLRVSMVVYVPPKWQHLAGVKPGSVVEAPTSLMDLAPTLLSLVGIPVPRTMHGHPFLGPQSAPQRYAFGMRDRMDERYDFVRSVTDGRYRYIRNYMPHRPYGMHGGFEWQMKSYQDWERRHLANTLNARQERFFHPKPFEELYDHRVDPDEIDNRIADPALRTTVERLRHALDEQMLAINDNGFIPESSPLEGYEASRAPGAYPLRDIMELAGTAASGSPRSLALLRKRLTHSNEVIRYWAATGLLIQRGRAMAAAPELLLTAQSDPSPRVRVPAAEALVHVGQAAAGIAELAALAGPDQDKRVRLQALNALTEVGDAARPAMAAITAAAADKDEYLQRAGSYLVAVLDGTYDPGRQVTSGLSGAGAAAAGA